MTARPHTSAGLCGPAAAGPAGAEVVAGRVGLLMPGMTYRGPGRAAASGGKGDRGGSREDRQGRECGWRVHRCVLWRVAEGRRACRARMPPRSIARGARRAAIREARCAGCIPSMRTDTATPVGRDRPARSPRGDEAGRRTQTPDMEAQHPGDQENEERDDGRARRGHPVQGVDVGHRLDVGHRRRGCVEGGGLRARPLLALASSPPTLSAQPSVSVSVSEGEGGA